MTDYHQRFREEFYGKVWDIDKVLAFIDEEKRKSWIEGYNFASTEADKLNRKERATLIEKVEGEYERWSKLAETGGYSEKGYASAYRDLLTWLRCPDQDGCAENPRNLPPFQTGAAFVGGFPEELLAGNSPKEETGCGCVCHKEDWEYPGCCPCHKPRTEETEKEGASFSGRDEYQRGCEEVVALIKEAAPSYDAPLGKVWRVSEHVLRAAVMKIPEKTNTPSESTPQSREQGGEKCCERHIYNWPRCKKTNQ